MLHQKEPLVRGGIIAAPPRSALYGSGLIIGTVAAVSIAMAVPAHTRWIAAVMVGLGIAAVSLRSIYAGHLALLFSIWVLGTGFVPVLRPWPWRIAVPLAFYAVLVMSVPALRRSLGWLRAGTWDRSTGALVAATGLLSGTALVGWVMIFNPDLERHLQVLRTVPIWAFPVAGAGFAVFNAALEEAVFRGVMMEALDSAFGEGAASVAIQALSFAAFHYVTGFPNGIAGFMMVAVYGGMLGLLRRRARGLLAPWAAHVAADAVIFAILTWVLAGA